MKNPLKRPPIGVNKKITWSDPPLVAEKKKSLEMTPHWWWKEKWLEKRSLELISIGVKWLTINNEKKVTKVTRLDIKKIHLSDFPSMGCEKTFHLKGLDLLPKFISHMNWLHWLEEKKTSFNFVLINFWSPPFCFFQVFVNFGQLMTPLFYILNFGQFGGFFFNVKFGCLKVWSSEHAQFLV